MKTDADLLFAGSTAVTNAALDALAAICRTEEGREACVLAGVPCPATLAYLADTLTNPNHSQPAFSVRAMQAWWTPCRMQHKGGGSRGRWAVSEQQSCWLRCPSSAIIWSDAHTPYLHPFAAASSLGHYYTCSKC